MAEAACIGVPDPNEVRGNIIRAYCILRQGFEGSDKLSQELRDHVGHEMGPIAKPTSVEFVDNLPKTRSGKILRGTMVKIADSEAFKMPATIDDPVILDEIRNALIPMGYATE